MSNLRPAAGALACMMLTLIGCQGAAPFPTNTSADADAGSVDGGSPDGGTVDGGGGDAGGVDAGMPDAGQLDAGTPDAGQLDAGTPDAGILDAGATDAGAADAGILDAGAHDAGEVDAGTTDAGITDAGTTDAGSGPDAGPTCLPTTDYQTDSNNCGTCGNVCTITSPSTVSCVEGRCLAVLAQSPFPLAMASDDTSIYWADHGSTTPTGGAIDKIATTGGRVQTLASGLPSPSAISVDSHAVYWAENEKGAAPLGRRLFMA